MRDAGEVPSRHLHREQKTIQENNDKSGTDPFLRSSRMLMLLVQLGADIQCLNISLPFAFGCREFYRRSKLSRNDLRILETLLDLGSNTDRPLMWAHHE